MSGRSPFGRCIALLAAGLVISGCSGGAGSSGRSAHGPSRPAATGSALTASASSLPGRGALRQAATHAATRVRPSGAQSPAVMSAGRAPARAETDPAAASLLLTRTALGKDWDDLSASNGEVQPHQYCGAAFASDAAVRDRSYTELVRHTDGLRIEQEVLRYAGDQDAARALTEFRTALECGRYSSGTGANRLDIEALRSSWEPAGPQDGESGSVTFTKGDVVLHTRLAIYRDGRFLNVLSIALHDDGALEHESPALARLALRAARWA